MADSTSDDPDKSPQSEFFPKKGERLLSIGGTGSGKTTANRWLLDRLPESPIIVYDTKHDPKFDELKNHRIAETMDQAEEALEDLGVDYVIIRPPPSITSQPSALDRILEHHENYWRGVDAYIDELYHFHKGPYAGPGLNGLYTRGRSRGITTIASTQRPAYISGFVFSETQLFYIFQLSRKKDRKAVEDFIDGFEELPLPAKHHFYAYRQEVGSKPKLMPPVPVDDLAKLEYTDHTKTPESAVSEPDPDEPKKSSIVWT